MSFRNLVSAKIKYELGKRCPRLLELYNYSLCNRLCGKVVIHNTDETLTKLCSGKVSMSRFGDGEFDIMSGNQNGFQQKNERLGELLKNVIKQNGRYDNFIVGIPRCFTSFDGFTKEAKDFLTDYYLKNRFRCYKFLNQEGDYYDAFVTRLYMDVEDKSHCKEDFERIRKIWENEEILIIEGDRSRLGMNNDLFDNAKNVKRILAPNENAFDYYDDILREGTKYGEGKLILLALGQTATALAYDLYKAKQWVIDIGHIDVEYEWFLQGANKKTAIKGKYVNEVNHRNVEEIDDPRYEKQIILRVGVNE